MKKKNSYSDFDQEKRDFLLRNFRKALLGQSEFDKNKAFHIASQTPTPRFWVSEVRAAAVIGKLLSGNDPTLEMLPEKREMFLEIYRRFLRLRAERKEETISQLLFEVINNEAPRSYLSWQTVRTLVYKEMRRRKIERRSLR
ncbi:MAG: hypothetical protein K2J82_01765 [Muribaculaceae bacterium]|nr:hypothetical protein [Muribaculaceae bacterium]MDE6753319.1 hypothetical protein [Muribaculaceae bacterium]